MKRDSEQIHKHKHYRRQKRKGKPEGKSCGVGAAGHTCQAPPGLLACAEQGPLCPTPAHLLAEGLGGLPGSLTTARVCSGSPLCWNSPARCFQVHLSLIFPGQMEFIEGGHCVSCFWFILQQCRVWWGNLRTG